MPKLRLRFVVRLAEKRKMGATGAMQDRSDSHYLGLGAAGLVLLLLCAAFSNAAAAADFDPYAVEDFVIATQAQDGVKAKEAALSQALASALALVFSRIATARDVARLPKPDAALAERLLDHVSILSERVAPTSYQARLRIAFSSGAVRRHLTARGVEVVDEPAPPILLIPVLVEDGIPMWWDAAERWSEALADQNMENGLTPARLPNNSAADRQERPDRLLEGDRVSLDIFRVRYRVQGVVVVRAETVRGRDRVALSLAGEDAAGPLDYREDVIEGGLEAAAQRVATIISERWKGALDGTKATIEAPSLAVRVLLHGGIGEWEEIRRRLEASGALHDISVEAVTGNMASVLLQHEGTPADLARKLTRQGLDLFEAGGTWLLQAY